jgi:4-hydroxybenzoyl-CoA thioesterase
MTFIVTKQIRIQHCDAAGVVFTPQYFNLFTEVLEDWWGDELGVSFRDLISIHQRAIPLRKFDGEFLVFSRLGDLLEFRLTVQEIRTASIKIRIEGHHSAVMRCCVNMQLVQVDLNSNRAIRWSEEWRKKILTAYEKKQRGTGSPWARTLRIRDSAAS